MSLESIVNIQISRQTAGVTQAGFGVPLILGPTYGDAVIREYSSLSAMVEEDYTISDPEYLLAAKIFSQTPRPEKVKVGSTTAAIAQVDTITPTVLDETQYYVQIDGVQYSFTSDVDATAEEIVTGLIAAINAGDAPVTCSGTTTLILTATVPGVPFVCTVQTGLTKVNTTPSHGIANDILDAIDTDNDWYFLLLCDQTEAVVIEAAKTIETLKKILVVRNNDADVLTNVTDDTLSKLKALSLFRTATAYNKTNLNYMDGGLVGRVAPLDPGSETWAFKTLASTSTDKFTDSQEAQLKLKNANYYITVAGVNVTQGGKVAGGEYIDVIRFIDWLQARMQEAIFSDLAKLDKLPFTDAGIAVIENDIRSVLKRGVRAGGIASEQDFTVTVPKAKDISTNDKAARKLTGIKFTAVLAGAIHAVEISGTVTL